MPSTKYSFFTHYLIFLSLLAFLTAGCVKGAAAGGARLPWSFPRLLGCTRKSRGCFVSPVLCKNFWAVPVQLWLCLGGDNTWHHRGTGPSSKCFRRTILSVENLPFSAVLVSQEGCGVAPLEVQLSFVRGHVSLKPSSLLISSLKCEIPRLEAS